LQKYETVTFIYNNSYFKKHWKAFGLKKEPFCLKTIELTKTILEKLSK
jgi:hypothetical protein